MSVATAFLAALAALIVSAVVGANTGNERLKTVCVGVTAVSIVVLVACVAAGLWEAWSPWDLQLEKK